MSIDDKFKEPSLLVTLMDAFPRYKARDLIHVKECIENDLMYRDLHRDCDFKGKCPYKADVGLGFISRKYCTREMEV
jgi:hypothetical protein